MEERKLRITDYFGLVQSVTIIIGAIGLQHDNGQTITVIATAMAALSTFLTIYLLIDKWRKKIKTKGVKLWIYLFCDIVYVVMLLRKFYEITA